MPATQVNPLHRTCHVRWNFKGANLLLLHGRAVATAGHSATTSSPCAGRCSLDEARACVAEWQLSFSQERASGHRSEGGASSMASSACIRAVGGPGSRGSRSTT